jgi:hypothetical protein
VLLIACDVGSTVSERVWELRVMWKGAWLQGCVFSCGDGSGVHMSMIASLQDWVSDAQPPPACGSAPSFWRSERLARCRWKWANPLNSDVESLSNLVPTQGFRWPSVTVGYSFATATSRLLGANVGGGY